MHKDSDIQQVKLIYDSEICTQSEIHVTTHSSFMVHFVFKHRQA